MTPAELLVVLRTEVDDEEEDFLWSDALLYGYIDDAQKQFCRLTYGIEDARQFHLTLALTKEWYPIDPAILKVRDALDSRGCQVPVIAYEKMASHGLRFDGKTGTPRALITGMQKGYLRTCPIPSAVGTIDLITFRLPETIPATGRADFEVDDQHHRGLLLWVKHRCYDVQDSEVYDKRKAQDFEARFEAYCFDAKNEQERINRPVGVVAYGGY